MRFLFFSSLLRLALPAQSQQSAWRGPLPMENQRPYQAVFLHFPAQNPDVLARNRSQLGVQFDIANNLLIPNISNGATVREDFETGRGQFEYRRGIGRNLELSASAQYIVRDGGSFDNAISFYHHLLGIKGDGPDNPEGRDNETRNQDILFFQDAQGQGINIGGKNGLGDTTLTSNVNFRQENSPAPRVWASNSRPEAIPKCWVRAASTRA